MTKVWIMIMEISHEDEPVSDKLSDRNVDDSRNEENDISQTGEKKNDLQSSPHSEEKDHNSEIPGLEDTDNLDHVSETELNKYIPTSGFSPGDHHVVDSDIRTLFKFYGELVLVTLIIFLLDFGVD